MAALVLTGLFLGKGRVEMLPVLFLTLFVHLVLWPRALYSLSFQLSYLAVLGLATVLPRLPRLQGWKSWLWASLSITLAAQVFLLPLLLHYFHTVPLLSPLSKPLGFAAPQPARTARVSQATPWRGSGLAGGAA